MPGEREGLAKKPTTPLSYSLKGTHMLESGWLPLMAHWEQSKWGDRGRSIASTSAVDDRGLRSSPPAAASELFFFPTILDLTALLHSRESSSPRHFAHNPPQLPSTPNSRTGCPSAFLAIHPRVPHVTTFYFKVLHGFLAPALPRGPTCMGSNGTCPLACWNSQRIGLDPPWITKSVGTQVLSLKGHSMCA